MRDRTVGRPPGDAAGQRGRRRREQSQRVGILAAAYELFAQHGFATTVKALYADKEVLRRQVHRAFVEHLKKAGALRAGLSTDRATDLFLGLASPGSMTAGHGWTQRQWAISLTDILTHALLKPDTIDRPPRRHG